VPAVCGLDRAPARPTFVELLQRSGDRRTAHAAACSRPLV